MLKDNFKDEIPQGGRRLYQITDDNTGGIIYNKVRIDRANGNTQDGDRYGAAEVNEERSAINQLSNPNLLINGDFQVWQKSTVYENVTNYLYTSDRWMLFGSAQHVMMIKKEAQGASIIGTITQKLDLCLRGKVVTISAKIDNQLYKITTDAINDTWKSYAVNSERKNIVFAVQTTTANITIFEMYLQNTNSQIPYHVEWIKMEIGEVATPQVPRPYVEELMLCQRYYVPELKIRGVQPFYTSGITYFSCNGNFPVEMRVIPSIWLKNVTLYPTQSISQGNVIAQATTKGVYEIYVKGIDLSNAKYIDVIINSDSEIY